MRAKKSEKNATTWVTRYHRGSAPAPFDRRQIAEFVEEDEVHAGQVIGKPALPPMPGVFPEYPAPIVRNAPDGVRELMLARWRMPGPPRFGGAPITNIRNTASPHWRGWLNVEHRCVVPFNSFCEYADTKPRKTPTWFALDDDRPLAFFAGIWTTWHGRRGTKANPVEGEHQLFGFLTTDANAEVGAVHPKAMPVILTSTEAVEQWLTLPVKEALALQKPLPDGALRIVATGEKEDGLAA
jgi:putative SOS response-associated peptidase YedK